ncbi:dipeptidase [Pseudoclavibacter soli]|uniref:dipeptidase n=1 Tax=Pseudoclavibacter soli TaxID=452623 RepID=UPI00041313AC|nr:dipeptidase [Pseudoclavibacter soli]
MTAAASTPLPLTAELIDRLRDAVQAEQPRALADLAELVAFPSVADPAQFDWSHSRAAAEWVVAAFRDAGVPDAHTVDTVDGSQTVVGWAPGPEGAPTVLLYSHYDVQPPLDESAWRTPPFELTTGDDGRLYGRGAADCKGNVVAHLAVLRALRQVFGELPVGVRIIVEGSEEQGGAGLADHLARHPEDFAADTIIILDSGNVGVGQPTLTVSLRGVADVQITLDTFPTPLHSGQFGGAAPDALQALIRVLDTLRDEHGDLSVAGIEAHQRWQGADYDEAQFRIDAELDEGAQVLGTGSVADQLWARPTVTVIGIDAPAVVGSSAAVQGHAAARLNLRVPPGMAAEQAQQALVEHLRAAVPWGAKAQITVGGTGEGFAADVTTPVYALLGAAMTTAFGAPVTFAGSGGAIPLTNALHERFPDAQIALFGVEDPAAAIHAPNESVDPSEIEHIALAEALLLAALSPSGH